MLWTTLGRGFIIICIGLGFALLTGQYSNTVDIPDRQAIVVTLDHAYDILAIPFDTLDLNQLAEVFVDHPIFLEQLTDAQRTDAQTRIHQLLGQSAAEDFGYLTAMKAKRIHQQHGARLLKETMTKAKVANRTLSRAEWDSLEEQNYGIRPYLPEKTLPDRFPLQIQSIKIDNDVAYVRYDDGPAL